MLQLVVVVVATACPTSIAPATTTAASSLNPLLLDSY